MDRMIRSVGDRSIQVLWVAVVGLMLALIGGLSATATGSDTTTTTTLSPVADSYVDASVPNANYGARDKLRTDTSPDVRSYLRFDLSGIGGTIDRATLRVWATSAHSSGYGVRAVADDSWTENAITSANAPPGGSTGPVSGKATPGAWTSVDVTAQLGGDRLVSLTLIGTTSTALALSSRESAHPPELVVEAGSGGPVDDTPPSTPQNLAATANGSQSVSLAWDASTDDVGVGGYTVFRDGNAIATVTGEATTYADMGLQAATDYSYAVDAFDAAGNRSAQSTPALATTGPADTTTTTTLSPVADSYVDASVPNANYGARDKLRTDTSPDVRSYLRFDLSGIGGTIDRATLRVWATSAHSSGYGVRAVADDSWTENAITSANAPPGGSTGPVSGKATPGAWTSVDVTAQLGGDRLVSLALIGTTSTALALSSRESGHPPELVVEAGSGGPDPDPTSTVVAAGDIACDPAGSGFNGGAGTASGCQQMATSNLAIAQNPAAVLVLGDNQYERGTTTQFAGGYDPSWGRLRSISHPAAGNHEYLTAGAQGYFDYWNGAGAQTGPAGDRTEGYYSFNLPGWHIVALNSNCLQVGGCQEGGLQNDWLEQDLAAHPSPCLLAFWHHPQFTSGQHHNETPVMGAMWDDLQNAGADLILAGHDHDYERFAKQDSVGQADATGPREFVVGTGGKNLRASPIVAPNSEVRSSASFGVLRLRLGSSSYTFDFLPTSAGGFTDSGGGSC